MTAAREELHRVVDLLPEAQVGEALAYLRFRVGPPEPDDAVRSLPPFVGMVSIDDPDWSAGSQQFLRDHLGSAQGGLAAIDDRGPGTGTPGEAALSSARRFSLEALLAAKGTQPTQSLDDLAAETFGSDEELREFLRYNRAARRQDVDGMTAPSRPV